ncbi:MAG: GNAT family N-acetyltransferase [Ktedonobacterales bacterium]|nr:GNAT family N-acetyltransferase [Ktedonobacterales bacterium]
MAMTDRDGVVGRALLTTEERAQIARLAATCNALEGLELKLTTDMTPSRSGIENNAFLRYDGDTLIGFCAIDVNGDAEAEICGMVHPAHRRRGIGRALLAAVRTESARRGLRRLLLICEAASRSGQGFISNTGATLTFSEYRLRLGPFQPQSPRYSDLTIQRADPTDVDTLAHITALAFGDPEDWLRPRIALDIHDPGQRFYLARLAGQPVASLKVYPLADHAAGIYAFGVLPDQRRRGIGRQVLEEVIAALLAEGRTAILLEVETTNTNADALYRSCGFREVTTYGYYALDLAEA